LKIKITNDLENSINEIIEEPKYENHIEIEPLPKEFNLVEGEMREIIHHRNIHTSSLAISNPTPISSPWSSRFGFANM
jgi:hypothetical protein